MTDQKKLDWIDQYGFILVAFAHMTDWCLTDTEIAMINDKLQLMLSMSGQVNSESETAKKLVKILQRYESLKEGKEKIMMDKLLMACESLKSEPWFDKLAATVVVQSLTEIAEVDHKIEKTEVQLLNNLSNIFGIKPPRL